MSPKDLCLNTWSLASSVIWEGFMGPLRGSGARGSMSLGASFEISNMVLLSVFFLFYLAGANMMDRSHALLPCFPYQDGLYWFWSCKLKYALSPLGSFVWVFHHSNRGAASTVKIRETQKSQTVKLCW